MTRTRSRQAAEIRALRILLVERFPACFRPHGAPKRPLKMGVHKDIQAALPAVKRRLLFLTLRDYTSGASYLRALKADALRVDLQGSPAGPVGPDAAEAAAAELAVAVEARKANERRHQEAGCPAALAKMVAA